VFLFFFNDTATTEIYTLSLHDALPISGGDPAGGRAAAAVDRRAGRVHRRSDRKSTRLNSSHTVISYAVFCLKKKRRHMDASLTPNYHAAFSFQVIGFREASWGFSRTAHACRKLNIPSWGVFSFFFKDLDAPKIIPSLPPPRLCI